MPTGRTTVAAATAGAEPAFATLVERHRRELHVHCYRMIGSFDEAEDVVQQAFLRAWRQRGKIAEITTFDAHLFPAFGLPPTPPPPGSLT